ncbi:MAG: PilZ domain-containing protein [Planctomycetes bacterium]|nr:PilZ domain-containing protein [Planctomycetota bacterium]
MSVLSTAALVQPVRNPYFHDLERRGDERHACSVEATSHPIEVGETLSWGAMVHDVSSSGLAVTLCYPFKPGTFLAVDLQSPGAMVRTLMVRVVHVHDRNDGQWRLGCEFVKPLTQSDMDLIL